jgi:multisubunit Na+/H+ antiporter MnhF subunit
MDKPDIRGLIRGVRLMFLSVATFVAAFGFLTGEAIFVVVAAVVAIVDVVETAIFLFVARTSSDRDDTPGS